MKPIPSPVWHKVASVSRSNGFFFQREIDRLTVVKAWAGPMAGRWHVYGQLTTFGTAQACMAQADADLIAIYR